MQTLKRTTIVSALLALVVLALCAPEFLRFVSGPAGAQAAGSRVDCAGARDWIDRAGVITNDAAGRGSSAADAGDFAGSVLAAVLARHAIAALPVSAGIERLRSDTLDALDELAYQSALGLTDPGAIDSAAAEALIAAIRADHDRVNAACSSAGSV